VNTKSVERDVVHPPKKIVVDHLRMSTNTEIRQKVLTENRIEDITFPVNPKQIIQSFSKYLTSYEQSEIQEYKNIYFIGHKCRKLDGNPNLKFNFG